MALDIVVTAVNDTPATTDDTLVMAEDERVTFDVLANDADVDDAVLKLETASLV